MIFSASISERGMGAAKSAELTKIYNALIFSRGGTDKFDTIYKTPLHFVGAATAFLPIGRLSGSFL